MSTQSSVSKFPSRWFDSLAVVLLFAALLTAASQLIATNWVDDLYVSWTLVFIGVFIGVLLGYSHFQPITVGLLTVLYGLFFVPWQLGLTLEVDLHWRERLVEMLYRYQLTFTQLNDGENVTSSLLFLTIVSILAWVLSVYTAYSLVRYGNAWKAIIPGALVMIIVATYGVKHGTSQEAHFPMQFYRINMWQSPSESRGETAENLLKMVHKKTMHIFYWFGMKPAV